jgi:type IV pilus assembly protein PilC
MPNFEYTAKDSKGNVFRGVYSNIDNINDLRFELTMMGHKLLKARKTKNTFIKRGKKIKLSEIVTFAHEFAGMYAAGLSITRCLEIFIAQTENHAFKEIISDVKQQIETGVSVKDAFGKYGEVFSEFFLGMVEAGEAGGKLAETLHMAADYLEKRDKLRREVRGAFAYPIVVSIMCVLIVTCLVIFVIPVFQKLYMQLNVPLPLPTMILMGISDVVRGYWWAVLSVIVVTVFVYRVVRDKPFFKAWRDKLALNMPIFGKLNRMVVVSNYVRTFTMMSQAGVPIIDSLLLAKRITNNTEMDKVAKVMQEEVLSGSSITEPMSKSSLFPAMIVQMAAAGEEAGILPEMLSKGVGFLDAQIEATIKSLLIKIEPILSVIIGSIVGSILMGVYLPMFDYMGHIK